MVHEHLKCEVYNETYAWSNDHNFSNLTSTIQISKVQKEFNGLRIIMIKLNHLTSCIECKNKHNDQTAPFFTCAPNATKGQDWGLPFFQPSSDISKHWIETQNILLIITNSTKPCSCHDFIWKIWFNKLSLHTIQASHLPIKDHCFLLHNTHLNHQKKSQTSAQLKRKPILKIAFSPKTWKLKNQELHYSNHKPVPTKFQPYIKHILNVDLKVFRSLQTSQSKPKTDFDFKISSFYMNDTKQAISWNHGQINQVSTQTHPKWGTWTFRIILIIPESSQLKITFQNFMKMKFVT